MVNTVFKEVNTLYQKDFWYNKISILEGIDKHSIG